MRPFRNGNDTSRGRNYSTDDGPLLSNELQNLDMELQILKRQREIIFKQRQVENQLFSQRLNTFDEPSSSFGRPDPKQNYNTNYSGSFGNPSKGYKRPADRSYDHTAPKQSRSNDWGDSHRGGNDYKHSNRPQPLMNAPMQSYKNITKPFPNNKPKSFEPRGSNPSYRPQNNFQASLPKPKSKKNSEKTAAAQGTPPQSKRSSSNDVLRPGIAPSPSVNGRLELALGMLLKHMRTSPLLSSEKERELGMLGMRKIKSIIRQRISSVMMNKRIGSMADIVAQYEKKYSKDPDREIIKIIEENVQNANNGQTKKQKLRIQSISATETERIQRFFKSRLNGLLKNKLQGMIDNLFKMYGDNEEEILECLKDLPELDDKEGEINKDGAADVHIVDASGNEAINDKEENVAESDEKTDTEKLADVETVVNEANEPNAQETVAESTEKVEDNNPTNVTVDLTNEENVATDEKASEEKEKQRTKVKQYYKLMDLLIENRLPKILPNFKDEIIKIMYCEEDFIVAKEMILKDLIETLRKSFYEANNLDSDGKPIPKTAETTETTSNQEPEFITLDDDDSQNGSEKMDADNQNKPDQEINKQNTPQTLLKGSQLFVMLLGKPYLPAKPEIYEFVNKFNPKSIKKHKTVNNLLVIGFENKDDYDKILEANETKVGDATFIIKANEVIASDKQKENTDKEEIVGETKETDKTKIDNVSDEKTTDETEVNNEGKVEEDKGEIMEEDKGQIMEEDKREIMAESTEQEVTQIDENTTEINDVDKESTVITDVNNEVTETTDKGDDDKVKTDENKESSDATDIIEENVKTDDAKDKSDNVTENINTDNGNSNTTNTTNLETIQESEEKDKEINAKTIAAAVATPTRSSSRLASITPSTIKTRRASRLGQ